MNTDPASLIDFLKAVDAGELVAAIGRVRERERALMEYVRGPEFTLEGLRGRFFE